MSLVHNLSAIDGCGAAPRGELGGVEAEALCAPLLFNAALVRGEVDHGVLGEHVEFGRVRITGAEGLARDVDHRNL